MSKPSPRHVGDVQQPVQPAEIDERAVLGEILHHAGKNRAFFQMLQRLAALLVLLAFQQFLARDHDVAALLVELDDRDFERLTLHAVEIANRPQIHLRSRQKRSCAQNVDREPALGSLNHHRLNRPLFVMRFLHLVPGVEFARFLMRQVDVALFRLPLLPHHFNFVARLHLRLAFVIQHLRKRQHAFRLRRRCPPPRASRSASTPCL